MATLTPTEIDRIGGARELQIATLRRDGSVRRSVPIWVVRVGDDLHIRAYHGPDGSWYRQARTSGRAVISAGGVEREVGLAATDAGLRSAIDDAYRAKYGRGMYVDAMITDAAAAATLTIEPLTD